MSDTVYRLTQVFPPQVPPGELRDLAGKFEAVRNASLACAQDAKAVVDGVLASNEGEAVTAFRDKMHGEQASLRQLENLADAALRTRDAHRSAAAGVSAAQVGMAAIAHVAETFLHRAESSLPFPPQHSRKTGHPFQGAAPVAAGVRGRQPTSP